MQLKRHRRAICKSSPPARTWFFRHFYTTRPCPRKRSAHRRAFVSKRHCVAVTKCPRTLQVAGDPEAVGIYSGGEFGISDGIILSTGSVCTAAQSVVEIGAGTTYVQSQGTDFGPPGTAGDTTSLTLSFVATESKGIYFEYVFASSELPNWGGSQYNDAFSMAINGQNLAVLQDGRRVTINNLVPNKAQPSTFSSDYIDNPQKQYFPYSGYTKVRLSVSGCGWSPKAAFWCL